MRGFDELILVSLLDVIWSLIVYWLLKLRFENQKMSSRSARPIFCGNLDYDARQSDIERLFGKYGNVERVDLKSG